MVYVKVEFRHNIIVGESAKVCEHPSLKCGKCKIGGIEEVSKLNYGYSTVLVDDFGGSAATKTVPGIFVEKYQFITMKSG